MGCGVHHFPAVWCKQNTCPSHVPVSLRTFSHGCTFHSPEDLTPSAVAACILSSLNTFMMVMKERKCRLRNTWGHKSENIASKATVHYAGATASFITLWICGLLMTLGCQTSLSLCVSPPAQSALSCATRTAC